MIDKCMHGWMVSQTDGLVSKEINMEVLLVSQEFQEPILSVVREAGLLTSHLGLRCCCPMGFFLNHATVCM